MKWRTFALFAIGLVVLGGVLHRREAPAAVAGPSNKETAPRFMGVATCMSSACHHKDVLPDAAGCEYTTWLEKDQHARAYAILFDERSRRIVTAYGQLADPKQSHPEKEALCLRCHSTDAPPDLRGPRFSAADGVGCESCHGPAEKWLSRHYLDEWKTKSQHDKEALGFAPTKNLVVRAGQCAACHVGSGDADVNHDLIAAGHPRLNFELGTYHAKLPHHWKEKGDNATADFASRLEAVGQVVSARAALRLLDQRASQPDKVWPEFAEYDCLACHHRLQEPSKRPASKGVAPWSDWYYSLLPAESVETKLLADLRSEMQKPGPKQRTTVARLARAATGQLDEFVTTHPDGRFDKAIPPASRARERSEQARVVPPVVDAPGSPVLFLLGAPNDDAPKATKTKTYWGVTNCIPCHKVGTELPNSVAKCDEYLTWKEDKHASAFNVLKKERGKRIGDNMKVKIADVAKDVRCLSCHGADVGQTEPEPTFHLEDGVSCTICHGTFKEWRGLHDTGDPKWRALPRDVKEDKYGMTDLWHPAKRAKLCASCHVGNSGEGKVVTHEMYAAGHPPLPNFELATFGEAMPPHWKLLGKKSEIVQARLHFVAGTLEQTALVVLGGVATFQNSLSLLQNETVQAGKANATLDLAQFDCYACHHDLKTPSWRQQRGYKGKPGRVPMRSWPAALVRLGIRQAAGADEKKYETHLKEFETRLQALSDAFAAQPYGDNEAIAKAAAALVAWCDGLLKEIESQPDATKTTYSSDAADRLLRELCAPGGTVDYESARQIAWAFKIIYTELHPDQKEGPILDVLKQIDADLNLNLTAGRENKILDDLSKTLTKMSAYEPERFDKHLAELRKLLDERRP